MERSFYTLVFPHSDNQGYKILYSTLYGSVIQIDDETLDRIHAGTLDEDEVEDLSEQGILVEDIEQQKKEARAVLEKKNLLDTRFDLTLVMNLDCNLDCTYCFEGDLKDKLYMSEDTADELVSFIASSLPENTKILNLDFYGGEPLLSRDLIKHISERLLRFADDRGVEYSFTLITNGTLLIPDTVNRLLPLGLKSVRVTLDGPRHVHDATRPFKGGGGSFDVILRNINQVAGLLDVNIGGNFYQDNYHDFPALLDLLIETGLGPNRIRSVKFDPVLRSDNWNMPRDFSDGGIRGSEPWLTEATLYLREEVLKRGFWTPEMDIFTCAIELKNVLVVNHDGSLYKCPGMIGKEAYRVGTLSTGVSDYSRAYNLDVWKNETCYECQYLPICYGGCRYAKLLRDGEISGVDCNKDYLEGILQTFIEQDLKYSRSQKDE